MQVSTQEEKVNLAIDIAIKLGVLTFVLYVVYLIAKPFLAVTAWGIIIAIAVTPLIDILNAQIKNRKFVILGLTVIVTSVLVFLTYLLSQTAIESSKSLIEIVKTGGLSIPPANETVKSWPFVGESLYTFWNDASQNLKTTIAPFSEEIKQLLTSLLHLFGSGVEMLLMFIASLVIAAIFLLHAQGATKIYHSFLRKLIGKREEEWAQLSTLTIRSVVNGVIGVAIIQSIFAYIGFALIDLPFPFVWAFLLMFFTIIQLPAFIIILPAIAFVFSQASGTPEIVFTVYILIVGSVDGILRPFLMGMGVKTPLLVILIGAIGGMILMGILGLFIGAVIFALVYELFLLWIHEEEKISEIPST